MDERNAERLVAAEVELAAAVRRYANAARNGRAWLVASVMVISDPAIPSRVVVVEPEAVSPGRQA